MQMKILAVFGGLAVIAALSVALVVTLMGQSSGALETQTALATASPGGPSEGIQIHGHWTIEVLEPDGSLVSRREFDNELVAQGTLMLSQLLGRTKTAGVWRIQLQGPTGETGPCQPNPSIVVPCVITETNSSATDGPHVSRDLQLTQPVGIGDPLVLQGGITALVDSDISTVTTLMELCDGTVSAATCTSTGGSSGASFFTFTAPSPAIPVLNGQGINVSVEISAFGPAAQLKVTDTEPLSDGTLRITVEVQDAAGNLVGVDNNTSVAFTLFSDDNSLTIVAVATGTPAPGTTFPASPSISATPEDGVIAIVLAGNSGDIYNLDVTGPFPLVGDIIENAVFP